MLNWHEVCVVCVCVVLMDKTGQTIYYDAKHAMHDLFNTISESLSSWSL